MAQETLALTILGMALVTYLPRLLPVWLLSTRSLPAPVVAWLRYVPAAVLSALLFPSILMEGGRLAVSAGNLYLIAFFPTLLAAWKTRSLFLAVIVGMLVVAAARFFS